MASEKPKMRLLEVGFVRDIPVRNRMGVMSPERCLSYAPENNLRRGPGAKVMFETRRGTVSVPMTAVTYLLERRVEAADSTS